MNKRSKWDVGFRGLFKNSDFLPTTPSHELRNFIVKHKRKKAQEVKNK